MEPGEKGNSCLVPRSARRLPLLALCRSQQDPANWVFVCVSSALRLLSPWLNCHICTQEISAIPLACFVSACASYLGINFVQDPPDDSYDLEAQVNGHGEVDGEDDQLLHAAQDEQIDDEPEGSGEGNGEEDLPERRHRERLISMANSRYLEDVIWYWRRLAFVYLCGHSGVS